MWIIRADRRWDWLDVFRRLSKFSFWLKNEKNNIYFDNTVKIAFSDKKAICKVTTNRWEHGQLLNISGNGRASEKLVKIFSKGPSSVTFFDLPKVPSPEKALLLQSVLLKERQRNDIFSETLRRRHFLAGKGDLGKYICMNKCGWEGKEFSHFMLDVWTPNFRLLKRVEVLRNYSSSVNFSGFPLIKDDFGGKHCGFFEWHS